MWPKTKQCSEICCKSNIVIICAAKPTITIIICKLSQMIKSSVYYVTFFNHRSSSKLMHKYIFQQIKWLSYTLLNKIFNINVHIFNNGLIIIPWPIKLFDINVQIFLTLQENLNLPTKFKINYWQKILPQSYWQNFPPKNLKNPPINALKKEKYKW
jgi:hypothetical protein